MAFTSIQSLRERIDVTADERERIVLLRELSGMLHPNDMPGALRAIKEALRLSRAIGSEVDVVQCMVSVGECYHNQGMYDRAERYLSRAALLLKRIPGHPDLDYRLHVAFGLLHRSRCGHVAALDFFNRALEISEEEGDRRRMADVRTYMSHVFMVVGDNRKAAELLTGALATYEDVGDREGEAIALNTLGDVCKELGDWDKAFRYYHRGMEIAGEIGHRLGEAIMMGNIAAIHLQRGELDEALGVSHRELILLRELNARQYLAGALYKLGVYRAMKGVYGEAMRYLGEALESAESMGWKRQVAISLTAIAEIHRNTDDTESALRHLDRALEVAASIEDLRVMKEIYQAYIQVYELTGEDASALRYYKLITQLGEELRSREATEAMVAMDVRIHNERLERERDLYRLRAAELEREMERKQGELTTMAMRLVQSNEFLGRLREQVLSFARGEGERHALSKTLLAQIEEGLHQKDAWQAFEQQFQQVHQGFMGKLSEHCPRLSPTELKVCSLLRINLSSKEIAAVLNISFRTVELHRTSVRKKMALPGSANLSVYLTSL